MNPKFEFLTSTRFWAMVLGAVSVYLEAKGIFGDPEMQLVSILTVGFVAIRTVDRAAEKLGQ